MRAPPTTAINATAPPTAGIVLVRVILSGLRGKAIPCDKWLRKVDARFAGITHLGNAITCRGKVVEIVEVNGDRTARVELSSSNQFGQTKIAGEALVALA